MKSPFKISTPAAVATLALALDKDGIFLALRTVQSIAETLNRLTKTSG